MREIILEEAPMLTLIAAAKLGKHGRVLPAPFTRLSGRSWTAS